MNTNWKGVAQVIHDESESGEITFPESVRMLMEAGFDGYVVDFRRSIRTYFMSDGASIDLETGRPGPVSERFDVAVIKEAIREAQALISGYTYESFCKKVASAGCAGYLVSIIGKRVLYFGRTGEAHTEYFHETQSAV